jgi:hypothetical protein
MVGEHMLGKMTQKYVRIYDRTGRLSPKGTDKRKTRRAATFELENDKEKKMRHEVNVSIVRIMFKVIFNIPNLAFDWLGNHQLIVLLYTA